jgi:hypothetical protein
MQRSRIGGQRPAFAKATADKAIAIVLLAWLGWATAQALGASSSRESAADEAAASSEPRRRADLQQLAGSYVDEYQKQLAAIVADEVYVQEIRAQNPPEEDAPRSRTLRGEVFFLFAAAEREWMAIRDVKEVNGVPLTGTRDVRATLRTLPAAQVADRMKSYNARYNIGRITRDINEPTLALLVLDATHRDRFKFKADKPRQVGDRRLVPLSFKERERPTLIRTTAGKPVYTSGELLVEPGNGRIWQSILNASVDAITVQLTTEYSFDERLGLLLPTVFRERYEQGALTSSRGSGRSTITPDHEVVVAEGRYSNFRRFEVLSRIR